MPIAVKNWYGKWYFVDEKKNKKKQAIIIYPASQWSVGFNNLSSSEAKVKTMLWEKNKLCYYK